MKRTMLAALAISVVMMMLSRPPLVHAEWRTIPTTQLRPGDPTLTLTASSTAQPALTVQSQTPGDLKWLVVRLPVTPGQAIDAVEICYRVPDEGTIVRQVRVVEELNPPQALVLHDEAVDLTGSTADCYHSPVPAYTPEAVVSLWLRLEFARTADVIMIDSVRIEVR
jgi:hypothetical protein